MKTIYVVITTNIAGSCYYETLDDALGFVRDQIDMGFGCDVTKREVTEDEFDAAMLSMEAA